MEIAWLEVATQWHLDQMQETATKWTMWNTAETPRLKGNLNQNPVAATAEVAAVAADPRLETPAKPQNCLQKARNPNYQMTYVGDVGNPNIRRRNTAKHWRQSVEAAEPKDIMKRYALRRLHT